MSTLIFMEETGWLLIKQSKVKPMLYGILETNFVTRWLCNKMMSGLQKMPQMLCMIRSRFSRANGRWMT